MDAAQTILKKIPLLFATALLLTAPLQASAATLGSTATSVTIGSSSCNDFQTVNITSSDPNAPIPFTVSVTYPNGNGNGDANGAWLYTTIIGSGTTSTSATYSSTTGGSGATMTIGLNRSIGGVADTATVTITDTGNPSDTITITVFYSQNTSCGGNTGSASNGFISVTPGNIAISAASNGQQSQTVTIQDTTVSPMTFGFSVSPSSSWLAASANTTTISGGGTVPLTITGDATKTAGPGTYIGNLQIVPQSGFGSSINIPVTFTVTSGSSGGNGGNNSGTLTIAGASNTTYTTAFTYVAPTTPGGQCIGIQDSAAGASSYTTQVSTSGGGNWLLANNQINATTVQLLASQYGACVNLTVTNLGSIPSGAYQGSVLITSSSGAQATINVNLYVSGGVATGITVQPSPVFVFSNVAVGGNVVQQQAFSVIASSGYTMGIASLASGSSNFSITPPIASNNTETFTVTSNSTGLIAGVYAATITITSTINNSTSTSTITVVLPVGQAGSTVSGGGGGTTTIAPTTLSFQQQQGSSFFTGGQEAQNVTITGAQGTQWSANIVYGNGASSWLGFDSGNNGTFGSGPATLTVDLANPTGLAPSATPYQATINIITANGAYVVAVNLLVTPATTPVLLALPASATFSANTGGTANNQTIQVVGSDNTSSATNPPISLGTPTAAWVTATPSGNTMTISVNASGQNTGVYFATIPVTASAYANPLNYPVILVVNGGGGGGGGNGNNGPLTLSTPSLSFTNVTGQISQNLNVTASSLTNFTATSQETNCLSQSWLSFTSGSFVASTTATVLSVTVNPSGLANGSTCNGVISLVTASATQTVNVSMTVGTGSGGNVTATPTTLSFNYTQNQSVPAAQNVSIVNATSGSASIAFTVSTAETSGTSVNWLQVSATSATTPYNSPGLAVSVAPGNLNPGQYTGTVTISPSGGSQQTVSVTLNISNSAVVTATPTTLSMAYTVGQASPTSSISVTAGGSTAAFTATASSNGGWLAVSPTTGTTPNTGTFNLNVSTVASALATLLPSGTPYTGTITVAGTSPATGTTIINVSLTVSAPLPVISSVNNAASGATGAVSPGELISLFANAAHPIGPATAVALNATTCPNGCPQVPTSMGGVQVKFLPSGILAPLLYVSSTQINAVVPYEIAVQGNSGSVEVLYLGQSSNAFSLSTSAFAPGLFASNGVGQAAAYQLDTQGNFSYNTSATPAKAGWTIVLYLTGEGVVTPAAATGSVTVPKSTNPPVPVPAIAPSVLVGNQPATVTYGEAPGVVSGVLQVNVTVPAGAGTGNVPIVVSFGNASTQTGVTVALQ